MMAIPSDINVSSPTSSTISSASSFDMVSSRSGSSSSTVSSQLSQPTTSSDGSDDEIVWSISDISTSSDESTDSNVLHVSDDDFVVLSPAPLTAPPSDSLLSNGDGDRSRTPSTASFAAGLSRLSVNPKKSAETPCKQKPPKLKSTATAKARKRRSRKAAKAASHSYPSPAPSPHPANTFSSSPNAQEQSKAPVKTKPGKKNKKNKKVAGPTGLGFRPIVDDISELFSEIGDNESVACTQSKYDEAFRYISMFLSNPLTNDSVCRLTLLQSLIVELGLAYSSLPASLTSAKAFLKSRVFVNIRDYLAVRGQGPAAVQKIMHPSRSALIKDIKKKRNPASLQWVKQNGLQVLLIQCYH